MIKGIKTKIKFDEWLNWRPTHYFTLNYKSQVGNYVSRSSIYFGLSAFIFDLPVCWPSHPYFLLLMLRLSVAINCCESPLKSHISLQSASLCFFWKFLAA
ncbi:MAG: hypothetical protein MHMPM18_004094 [Marteilia pararefringens]